MSAIQKHESRRSRTKRERQLPQQRAGWSIGEYFPNLVGFGGRTTFYALPEDAKPRHFHVGRTVLITEPPAEYVSRIEQLSQKQGIQLRRAA